MAGIVCPEGHEMQKRRTFLAGSAAVAVGASLFAPGRLVASEERAPIDADLVGEFVGKSHRDLKAVRQLLEREPALINAAWDWGNGDWETGLGAASHVGQPDIAQLILDRGARIDVFAATMLGYATVVRAFLDAFPGIHAVAGPHGIPLMSHAIVGRERAADIVELLLDRGANVNARSDRGVTPLMAAASIGRVETIDLLLSHGADPALRDGRSRTALDLAVQRERKAAADRLRSTAGN